MKKNLEQVVIYLEYNNLFSKFIDSLSKVFGYVKKIKIVKFVKVLYFMFDFLFIVVEMLKVF